jgi:hypothetical protein
MDEKHNQSTLVAVPAALAQRILSALQTHGYDSPSIGGEGGMAICRALSAAMGNDPEVCHQCGESVHGAAVEVDSYGDGGLLGRMTHNCRCDCGNSWDIETRTVLTSTEEE